MSEPTQATQVCPYLGLAQDRDVHFSYPEAAHGCFAANRATSIGLEHQSDFCLTKEHPTCPRFVEPSPDELATPTTLSVATETEISHPARFPLWAVVVIAMINLLVIAAIFYPSIRPVFQRGPVASGADQAAPSPTPDPTASL
jgi:hypothetical protein